MGVFDAVFVEILDRVEGECGFVGEPPIFKVLVVTILVPACSCEGVYPLYGYVDELIILPLGGFK